MPEPATAGTVRVGHPVDVASGAVYTAWDDLALPPPYDLEWSRFYSTGDLSRSALGVGWNNPYFTALLDIPGGVVFAHDDGQVVLVPDPETGALVNSLHQIELFVRGDARRLWMWGERKWYDFDRDPRVPDRWRLARMESASGYVTDLVYDGAGLLRELRQGPVRRVVLGYNDRQLIDRVAVDPGDGDAPVTLVWYEYDAADCLVAVLDAAGNAMRYAYDAEHRLTRETNRLGGAFHFEYDADGRCVRTYGDGGLGERRLVFVDAGHLTRVTDATGAVSTYQWNARGQIVREVDPLGSVMSRTFDDEGRPVTIEYPLGAFLQLQYDTDGNLSAVVDGRGHRTEYEYGPLHLVTRRTAADGSSRTYRYSARGDLVARTDEMGATHEYRRDERGRVVEAITPGGHRTRVLYDPAERWHELRSDDGFTRYAYDALGSLVAVTDARGLVERREYDRRGNLTAYVFPNGSRYAFEFDANGNVTAETDQNGLRTAHRYDVFDNLVTRWYPDGSRIALAYDIEGRLSEIENENGDRARFGYNPAGNLVAQQFFDGRVERYAYDAAGNLVEIVKPDGTTIAQRFDAVGNLVGRTAGTTSVTCTFDACDRMASAATDATAVTFAYDAAGRLTRETQDAETVAYVYDADGNRTRVEHVGGAVGPIQFAYDDRRRLRRLFNDRGLDQRLAYDVTDQLVARGIQDVAVESFTYDGQRRLTEQRVRDRNGTTLVGRVYAYDPAGQLVGTRDSARGVEQYTYDARARLVLVDRVEARDEVMAYDAAGNPTLIGPAAATSRGNRLLEAGDVVYDYDANGQLAAATSADARRQFSFDADERLVSASVAVGRGQALEVRYGYDALRRRLWKSVDGAVTRYVWAGHQLLAEVGPDGTYIAHVLLAFHPLAQYADGAWQAVVTSQASVPTELVDAQGAVIWRATYDGFGRLVRAEGRSGGSPFRLLGQQEDAELGLHYNRFRYYDPRVGRYLSPDPIGLLGGLNEYRFVENTLNWEDALGLKCGQTHFRVEAKLYRGPLAAWLAKRDAFNAARQNPNARVPSQSQYDNTIRPAADREAAAARRAGGFGSNEDADHPGDVRATGLLGQQLEPRASGVNRSFGSQVGPQARALPAGTRTPEVDLVDQNGNIIP